MVVLSLSDSKFCDIMINSIEICVANSLVDIISSKAFKTVFTNTLHILKTSHQLITILLVGLVKKVYFLWFSNAIPIEHGVKLFKFINT